MPRYQLITEYDGSLFHGWQAQPCARPSLKTVQDTLEQAFFHLLKYKVHITGAGRTDKGVHAKAHVAHVDLLAPLDPHRIRQGVNYYLKDQGVFLWHVEGVSSRFHARFCVSSKTYTYVILNRRVPSVFQKKYAWWVPAPLNIQAMEEAGTYFVGHHNFTSFCSSKETSPKKDRTLTGLSLNFQAPYVFISLQSCSFLRNQARVIVGTLKKIGEEKCPPSSVQEMLTKKDRKVAGPTAPAHGLYITSIQYDDWPNSPPTSLFFKP